MENKFLVSNLMVFSVESFEVHLKDSCGKYMKTYPSGQRCSLISPLMLHSKYLVKKDTSSREKIVNK
jgi:hypothetical protein